MPTNVYFNNFSYGREQDLVEDLTIESIKMYGHSLRYIPKTVVRNDPLFGEDTLTSYNEAAEIEMYIRNVEGFEGDGDFLSKFNLEIRDQITFTVARKRFDQAKSEKLTTEVGYNYLVETANTNSPSRQYLSTAYSGDSIVLEEGTSEGYAITTNRPVEGDLIYFPLVGKMFEIKFVEHESIFYQTGRLQTYDLRCELFEYSNERIDTGNTVIDAIEDNYSTDILTNEFTLETYLARATGTVTLSGGSISSVTITDGGSYETAPTVTFSAPPQGVVSGVAVTVSGAGHINGQTYSTTGGSGSGLTIQGTGTGGLVGAAVVNGGSGYEVGDVVQTVTDYPASIQITSLTNHTQATGIATINSSGVVTGVTITEGGSGYTGDSHTVTFSQGEITGVIQLEEGGSLMQEYRVEVTQPTANNEYFQSNDPVFSSTSVIDFSESNPFSEIDRY